MRSAILAFTAGAAWLQTRPALPETPSLAACAVTAIVVCVILRGMPRMLIAGVLLGACWAALLAHIALSDALPRAAEGNDIAVTGVVASLPHRFDGGVRF